MAVVVNTIQCRRHCPSDIREMLAATGTLTTPDGAREYRSGAWHRYRGLDYRIAGLVPDADAPHGATANLVNPYTCYVVSGVPVDAITPLANRG